MNTCGLLCWQSVLCLTIVTVNACQGGATTQQLDSVIFEKTLSSTRKVAITEVNLPVDTSHDEETSRSNSGHRKCYSIYIVTDGTPRMVKRFYNIGVERIPRYASEVEFFDATAEHDTVFLLLKFARTVEMLVAERGSESETVVDLSHFPVAYAFIQEWTDARPIRITSGSIGGFAKDGSMTVRLKDEGDPNRSRVLMYALRWSEGVPRFCRK
jgi:hypothetical protein